MNAKFETALQIVVRHFHFMGRNLLRTLAAGAILFAAACSESGKPDIVLVVDPVIGQAVFDTPAEAATAFILVVEDQDEEMLRKLLGDDFRSVLPLDEVSLEDREAFLTAAKKSLALLPQGDDKMLLVVGEEEWTLPIPVVVGESGWYFDAEEGFERILIRRIGRNELAAIQAVLAYYDAQMEYAGEDRNDDGMLEYAQQIVSPPETHDGLYWEVEPGEELSPLGPLMADRVPGHGYHGYFYRILEAQGEHARGGAYRYIINGRMRFGFALIAWPEAYGESGVMSFIVNHSGVVYEQNLGPDGAAVAKAMQAYDPDSNWVPTKEVSPEAAIPQ